MGLWFWLCLPLPDVQALGQQVHRGQDIGGGEECCEDRDGVHDRGPSWHALRSDGPENKYMADRLLVELLCKQVRNGIVELNSDSELYVYNLETPIDFMENMKTNFVEKKVGERWGSCRPWKRVFFGRDF